MESFKIIDFGCKLNQYESQAIRELLLKAGFIEKDSPDIFIVNSCCVTQRAENKTKEVLRKLKKRYFQSKTVLCGCLVDLYGKESLRDLADLVLKNEEKYNILKLLGKEDEEFEEWDVQISYFRNHTRAFVKVQTGCDNFCSFCVIPYVRGKPKSRPKEKIIEEIETFIKRGYKEVVLSGICLGKYGRDFTEKFNLVDLLEEILKIEGEFRIRLSSIEPQDVTLRLIKLISQNKKMCSHLHIPFQSGDDKVLRLMNRKYTVSDYLKIVEIAKEKIENFSLTTDIIVGFPDEDKKSFENTIKFLRKVFPLKVHIFSFSKRPLTQFRDITLKDKEIKAKRKILEQVCKEVSLEFRRNFLHKNLRVLSEAKNCEFVIGLTDNYIKVFIKDKSLPLNKFIQAQIVEADSAYTYAETF